MKHLSESVDPEQTRSPAADLRSALSAAEHLDAGYRREHLVLEASTPGGLAYSGAVRDVLVDLGAQLLGSRGSRPGMLAHQHNALFVVATDETWRKVAEGLDDAPPLPALEGFALPNAVALAADESYVGVWEATLHPDPCRLTAVDFVPVADTECDAFSAAVARLGGEVTGEYLRVSGLTTVPVRLPDAVVARRLGDYNPLRSLRPVTRVSTR